MSEIVLRSRYIMAGGVKTHYTETGNNGPPIVLLHGGAPGSSGQAAFGRILLLLGQKFHAIAIDSVGGYGFTDTSAPVPLGIQSRVEHLADFVNALCLGEFGIGGNSQGAWVAAQYALTHTKRVNRLFMMAGNRIPEAFGIRDETTDAQQILQSYDGTRESMKKIVEVLVMDPTTITDEIIDLRQASASRPGAEFARKAFSEGTKAYLADPSSSTSFWMAGRLDSIPIPTVFVWGEEDNIALPSLGKQLAPLLPNTPFHWIAEARHQAQNDQPAIVGKIMMDFFGA